MSHLENVIAAFLISYNLACTTVTLCFGIKSHISQILHYALNAAPTILIGKSRQNHIIPIQASRILNIQNLSKHFTHCFWSTVWQCTVNILTLQAAFWNLYHLLLSLCLLWWWWWQHYNSNKLIIKTFQIYLAIILIYSHCHAISEGDPELFTPPHSYYNFIHHWSCR